MRDTRWIINYYHNEYDKGIALCMYWNPYLHCWPKACNESHQVFDWGDNWND